MKKVGKQITQKKEEKIKEESQKIKFKKNNSEPTYKVNPYKNLNKKKEKWKTQKNTNKIST